MESTPRPPNSSFSDSPRVMRSVQSEPRFASPAPAAGFNLSIGDIYYALFRQKWKIVICAFVGLAAAATFYKLNPVAYKSRASLMIRYVAEKREIDAVDGEDIRMKNADQPVINSEIQIMTSLSLMELVARDLGAEKVLSSMGGEVSLPRAASVLRSGFRAYAPPRNNVVILELEHADPAVSQPALSAIIERYLRRHQEIHRSTGMVASLLAQETDQARTRLARTDEQLRDARNRAGIISLEASKADFASRIAKLRNDILETEAQIAERQSLVNVHLKAVPGESAENIPEPTPNEIRQYQALLRSEAGLQKNEQDLLAVFTDDNIRVKQIRERLSAVEKSLRDMEEANPRLAMRVTPPAGSTSRTGIDLEAENARLISLQARLRLINSQFAAVRAEATALDQMEIEIRQLERLRDQQEASYSDLASSMDRMRINDALGSGSVTNIMPVENPTPPFVDNTQRKKVTAGIAGAGIAIGLAWAFIIELFLDRSVRRPADIKRTLNAPLFLSIPRLGRKQLKVAADSVRLALPSPKGGGSTPPVSSPPFGGNGDGQLATWENAHPLHAFHETLRDRLISYFESINLTHKPKLVAVTGLGDHAGVTTTAAGLAASLSETGDGNVLLVDMTAGQGSAQQFYQGKAVCGIEEVLEARDNAQIESNLYVVGEELKGERLSRILPHRFNKLVPQLKASNFDYIIFDMPPVSQISITPRLAGFMDMTLLVLESEKTDRDIAAQAADLLAQSKTHVGVVLNKTKSYVPKLLHQDREFLHGM